jgi:sugar lactone lactonase YvrE
MKKILYLCLLAVCCSLLIADAPPTVKQHNSTTAFTVAEKDLFPEGITYDAKTEQFFLGSISKKKIITVGMDGSQADFAKSGQDGISNVLGLKVDTQRRRLWAVSYNGKWGGDIIAAVHIFDIDSKKLVKKLFTERGKIPVFNDLTITKDGGAYITDCVGHAVYYVAPDLEKLELLIRSEDELTVANGIVIAPDNSFLYVASEMKGIVLVEYSL